MRFFCLFFWIVLTGCRGHYLSIAREPVGPEFLASTFVSAPDPMRKKTMEGTRLFVSYRLPFSLDPQEHKIVLEVLFKDFSVQKWIFEMKFRSGVESVTFVDEEFRERRGILGYRAVLVNQKAVVIDERKSSFMPPLKK